MHATIRRFSLSFAVLLAVAGAAACAGFAAKGEAETGVVSFHGMLDAERYAEIYGGTDELFKNATPEAQFTEILQAVHRKLGVVVSTTQTNFYSRDQAGINAGSYISLTYKTEFAEGPATESFNWRVVDGKVHLAGYNIQSSLLITR
jgi:ABC-type glycerol-3-phosphate transport system substrate-binding protein